MSERIGPYRILFIQHAGSLGGSVNSLAYLVEALDSITYETLIACIDDNESVIDVYRTRGINAFHYPGISSFPHTTLGWYRLYNPMAIAGLIKRTIAFWPSIKATRNLIESVNPDIVHLNSLVLAASAIGVRNSGVPLVWHVREPVHPGHFGFRKALLSFLVARLADEAIFISDFDQRQLTKGRKGIVVHNFVNFSRFDNALDGASTKAELGLPPEAKVVLFLGGQGMVKGIFPLLEALPIVKEHVPEMHCLIGGGQREPSRRISSRIARKVFPIIGYGTVAQRVEKCLNLYNMHGYVHMLPWREDVPQLIAASDVVVFPSVQPHFARPVIEAGAMAKPVVASRIGGVEELVEDGVTGLLVKSGDGNALANALIKVLRDAELAKSLGAAGLERARARYSPSNMRLIEGIYQKLLAR